MRTKLALLFGALVLGAGVVWARSRNKASSGTVLLGDLSMGGVVVAECGSDPECVNLGGDVTVGPDFSMTPDFGKKVDTLEKETPSPVTAGEKTLEASILGMSVGPTLQVARPDDGGSVEATDATGAFVREGSITPMTSKRGLF